MKKLILILSIMSYITSHGQSVKQKFTVREAVEYALLNNLNLSKTEIEKKIVQAQIAEIKGQALPQINLNTRLTDNFSLAEQQLPAEIVGGTPGTTVGVKFGNRYALTGGLDVQQQLLNFTLFNSIKSVKALQELQELQTLQTKEDLIINVVQVYTQIQIREKKIELLQENDHRSSNLIELSELKLKEGIMRKLDVNQLKVSQSNLNTEIEDTQYTQRENIRMLKILLNLPEDQEIELSEKLEGSNKITIQDELTIETNVDLMQTEKQIELANIDEKLVKAEFYPKLNAFFTYNYQGNANEFKFSGPNYTDQFNGTWGLAASVPLFDGFQKRKRLLQKELATEKLITDKKLLEKNIKKEYKDAREQIAVSEIQVKNQKENMALADENYNGVKLSFTEGIAAITELLDSEYALRQAQSNYLNAQLQLRVSELQLIKASGQLSKLITQN
ncbi:TolC family protein [Flavobacterium frigoris]|uniref:Outer membrane efflux protein n=1 Tax=Flavobacterium frigoris (strain PS1) TaxID=1086011 RepID=H7FTP5_FLAFP|nr:TolC family protein [Flavobacterium frigoris]EIA08524.1 outer membrane efflux protein precursor [Flavobacterium frigoris PS1]